MGVNQKTVSPVYIRLLIELFQQWGVAPERLLEGSGLRLDDLYDLNKRVSVAQEMDLYARADRISPAPEWALRLGQSTSLQSHGVYGYAISTCADLEQALLICSKFFKLAGSAVGVKIYFHPSGDQELRLLDTSNRLSIHRCSVEEMLSAANTTLMEITNGAFAAKAVTLDYPAPAYKAMYREVFGCPVTFGAEHSGLVIAGDQLSLRIPTWDPDTQRACERQCELILDRIMESQDFVDSVRKALLMQPQDRRGAEFIAERLHMSARNLRRKLEQEGTSFQSVLDDVRCELTREYLGNSRLPLDDIAPLVGFTTTSALRRAFKKWTGQTPGEFRESSIRA